MFAVIQLAGFPLQALLRLRPDLRGQPVALLAGEGRRAVIEHVNPMATGITPGMTAAQALADCPALQLVLPSLAAEREAGALLLSAAWSLSPSVEFIASGSCTVDLTRCSSSRLPAQIKAMRDGLAGNGLAAKVGVGANALLARYAAHLAEPELWVKDPKTFLAPLPLGLLDLTAKEERLFADLGLRTLGSLTKFPRAALVNRLGARGDALWSQAAGEWSRPLQPAPFPVRHHAEMDFEEPVETLEPLLFTVRRFCERLALEVSQFGGGTSRLALVLKLEADHSHARDFDLPEPTANADILFAVLENHLASLQTDTAIIGFSLEVFPSRRLEQQEGLFDIGLKDAPLFFATLGRLAAVVGSDNVGTPRRADTHRSDGFMLVAPTNSVPERIAPQAPPPTGPLLRRLRPPVAATVELTATRPRFLYSPLATGEIQVLRRPFRSNGNWWRPDAWSREEWDVQIGGALYRLLHQSEGWFIEGVYD
ncbi:MAG: DNA polymerase Y family protein [Opitutaceae bacterium]|nr:DNA polymerase Y family protein [Cephaloticoccus sp.]MCP5530496.1 DNA polymerase Y family protein [Opitutaceae bacterium]